MKVKTKTYNDGRVLVYKAGSVDADLKKHTLVEERIIDVDKQTYEKLLKSKNRKKELTKIKER